MLDETYGFIGGVCFLSNLSNFTGQDLVPIYSCLLCKPKSTLRVGFSIQVLL